MDKPELISPRDIKAYQRDGAVCLRGIFAQSWVDRVAKGIARNLALPSQYAESLTADGGSARFFNDYCNWRAIPEFQDFVFNSPAAEIAARLMGSQHAIFYHEHVLIKEPTNPRQTPWHHDQPYYPVNGEQMCSLWMPLDPVPHDTSLQFIKGSHAWGRWFVPRKFATAQNYALVKTETGLTEVDITFETVPDIEASRDDYEILAWALNPGDCVVFNGLTLHGAAGNVSPRTSRRALSTRWFGEEAGFAPRPWNISPPITGGLQAGDPMMCETFPIIWSLLPAVESFRFQLELTRLDNEPCMPNPQWKILKEKQRKTWARLAILSDLFPQPSSNKMRGWHAAPNKLLQGTPPRPAHNQISGGKIIFRKPKFSGLAGGAPEQGVRLTI